MSCLAIPILQEIGSYNWYQIIRLVNCQDQNCAVVQIVQFPKDPIVCEVQEKQPLFANENINDENENVHQEEDEEEKMEDLKENPITSNPLFAASINQLIETQLCKKRLKNITYLSPNLAEFKDDDQEIEDLFWKLSKNVDPKCPEDIDIEAIRNALKERQRLLGRDQLDYDSSEPDIFDKYRLGQSARKLDGYDGDGLDVSRQHIDKYDDLLKTIDRMAKERVKPITKGKDLYDKNNPITGKVGFRRTEIGGKREFTDLDEDLSFGGLDDDVDFRKYLESKGRGRFDSKGNFILNDPNSKDARADGDLTTGKRGDKTNKGDGGTEGQGSDVHHVGGKSDNTLKHQRRGCHFHVEDGVLMCNYPKWVHRVYRMDQEKIGELIKNADGAPKDCLSWLTPEEIAKSKLGTGNENQLHASSKFQGTSNSLDNENANKQTLNDKKHDNNKGLRNLLDEKDGRLHVSLDAQEGVDTTFGMDDFLRNYENEMLDLLKSHSDSDSGNHLNRSNSYGLDDLLEDFLNEEQREDNELKALGKRQAQQREEDDLKKKRDKYNAQQKMLQEHEKKQLQEASFKQEDELNNTAGNKSHSIRDDQTDHKSKPTDRRSTRYSKKSKKLKKQPKITTVDCLQRKTWPRDKSYDLECMKRFNVLLKGENDTQTTEEKFRAIRKEIKLFTYQSAPPKKTPCERAAMLIC